MKKEEILKSPEVLLVIGNGFDLQCGLKSGYKDFLISSLFNKAQGKLKNEEVIEKWSTLLDNEKYMYNGDLNGDITSLNLWYILFLHKNLLGEMDWNFIEKQVLKELIEVENITNNFPNLNLIGKISLSLIINKNLLYTKDISQYSKASEIREYKIYHILATSILNRTIDEEYKEKQVYKEMIKKINEIENNRTTYTNKYTIKELMELSNTVSEIILYELKEVEKDFKNYLSEEINIKNKEYIDKSFKLITKLIGNNKFFNILSFNYTTPWLTEDNEEMNAYINMFSYINIHGSLKSNIIFGIDEGIIEENSSEYKFTKVARILESQIEGNNYITPMSAILAPTIKRVVFYGHSLSEADYKYLRMILDKYVDNDKVIFEFYYSVYPRTTNEEQSRILRDSIASLFGMYAKSEKGNKDTFSNLLTNNRIRIKLI